MLRNRHCRRIKPNTFPEGVLKKTIERLSSFFCFLPELTTLITLGAINAWQRKKDSLKISNKI